MKQLSHTKFIITKTLYKKKTISLENIIPWEKLANINSIANGPDLSQLAIPMAWSSVLKLLLEITLIILKKDPDTYFDRSVTYTTKKRKSIEKIVKEVQANSDDDFVDPAPKVKKQKKTVLDNKQKTTESTKTLTNTAATAPVTHRVSVIKQLNKQSLTKNKTDKPTTSDKSDKQPETLSSSDSDDHTSDEDTPTDDQVDPMTPPPCTRSTHVTIS